MGWQHADEMAHLERPQRVRRVLEILGPTFVKLGQLLSTRADLLRPAYADALARLQDDVEPFPFVEVAGIVEDELKVRLSKGFAQFEEAPLAAASLGQVHYATLHDGREIAVKVQRPRIDEIVDVDLSAVRWAVQIIKNYPPIKRRANLELLLAEFERVLHEELDYIHEAHNAQIIRANFAEVPDIAIPMPYAELTTRRVLVMERMSGIKISDTAALDRAGVDRLELAHRFYRAYLKQFFLDGIFNADPHPGNLFVRVDGPPTLDNGRRGGAPYTLIFVDFGMVGRLSPRTVETLRESAIALATNDAGRFVDAFDRLGVILPGADRRLIVQAAQILFRHTYDRSIRELSNIDVQGVFGEVEHLVRNLPFQMPQDLIYLGRAVGMVSGLAMTLAPDINLYETLRPFAQELLARERREGDWVGRLRNEFGNLGQIALTLPRQMDTYYKAANRGELRMQMDLSRLERGMRRVERATTRLAGGIVAVGLFLGGVLLRINGFGDEALWAWVAAGLAGVWTLWPRGDR
jgi:predicted unusual protein kinase regulating ubiquinone biosynthesis (AarF/ABC1/UbiB family)